MGLSVSRVEFQRLSDAKMKDACLLFEHERWANAFYLAGYSVELALKACAARQFIAEALPDKKLVDALYTHQFDKLIGAAGLRAELRAREDADSIFSENWGIAAEWTPEARYSTTDKSSVDYLLNALSDEHHGVLSWIKLHW